MKNERDGFCIGTATRRRLLQGMGSLMVVAAGRAFGAVRELPFFVGTYDKNNGLVPLLYRPETDAWSLGTPVPSIQNASFGTYGKRFGLYYLLDERDDGQVGTYRATNMGADWMRVGEASTKGGSPCFVTLDKAERCMVVANYNSGNLAIYRLDPANGLPSEPDIRQDSGHGPIADRQAGPHAHCARFSPDQRFLYSTDLGADQVLGYAFDAQRSDVGKAFIAFEATPGTGPRHIVFHPHLAVAYLASELANNLTVLHRLPDGRLEQTQTLSTLPPDFKEHNQTAHIAINRAGTRLYVSNRGHNSIAVFALGNTGQAKLLQHAPTLGNWPRFFLLVEEHGRLIVANERSGDVTILAIAQDGRLQPTPSKLRVPEAVFVGQVHEH